MPAGVTIALLRASVGGGASAVLRGLTAGGRAARPLPLVLLAVLLLQTPEGGAPQRGPYGRGRRGSSDGPAFDPRRATPEHREFRFTRAAYTAFWSRNWATASGRWRRTATSALPTLILRSAVVMLARLARPPSADGSSPRSDPVES